MSLNLFFKTSTALLLLLTFRVYAYSQEVPRWVVADDKFRQQKKFMPINFIYEPQIKSVQLYYSDGTSQAQMNDPVVPIGLTSRLILEFDEIGDNADYYMAKLVHCNHDWTVSDLSELEYLKSYNEFRIQNYEYSINTPTPYTHFSLQLPAIRRSGNYILKVFREGDEDDLILTRRLVAYEERAHIMAELKVPVGVGAANELHQVNFSVNYKGLDIPFPDRNVWVTLRQNERWDNAIMALKPRFIRSTDYTLDYNYFDFENAFLAGNEFRTFGFRNLSGAGLNVKTITDGSESSMDRVVLYHDIKRGDKAFNQQQQDLNGSFFVQLSGRQNSEIEADYKEVVFTLKMDKVQGDIYLLGKFTDWQLQDEFRMTYLPDQGVYMGSAILKQGLYDYMYTILKPDGKRDDQRVEGSFRLTKNLYDIIVYYRKIGERGDRVIGYKRLRSE
ncbi:DUF5103 domain-containing protein [Limibacter armeniacum]|uniref:type IX secretion system plug protein n=1 Tax=Limibacter armeniacum TaxID=466084 RepID=UPI002FE517EB